MPTDSPTDLLTHSPTSVLNHPPLSTTQLSHDHAPFRSALAHPPTHLRDNRVFATQRLPELLRPVVERECGVRSRLAYHDACVGHRLPSGGGRVVPLEEQLVLQAPQLLVHARL